MLLVVSTNPTIDRTLELPVLHPHGVHRSQRIWLSAGGKGLNVGRAAKNLDLPYRVVGFLGGFTGELLAKLAREEGLETSWLRFPELETKMSYLLKHRRGDSTVINEPGPRLEPQRWRELVNFILEESRPAQAVVLAGSVPPGVESGAYIELCRQLSERVPEILVDTPGHTLQAVVADPRRLSIKVNREELGEALGFRLKNDRDLYQAGRLLLERGARLVCITLGREGAMAFDERGAWRASFEAPHFVSSVGSGDSFSAGLSLYALRGMELPQALAWASACGAANAQTDLPAQFTLEGVERLVPQIEVQAVV